MDVVRPVLRVAKGFAWFVAGELLDLYDWATGRDDEFQRWCDEHPGVVVYRVEDVEAARHADTEARNPYPYD